MEVKRRMGGEEDEKKEVNRGQVQWHKQSRQIIQPKKQKCGMSSKSCCVVDKNINRFLLNLLSFWTSVDHLQAFLYLREMLL